MAPETTGSAGQDRVTDSAALTPEQAERQEEAIVTLMVATARCLAEGVKPQHIVELVQRRATDGE